MKKIINYLVVFIFVTSCSYEPVFKKTKGNLEFGKVTFNGDEKISNLIYSQFKKYESNESKKVINFNSSYDKIVASKDKKGNASSYKISIVVDLYLNNKSINKNFEKRFMKETIYNSMENKFELSQYKKNLEKNMISQILQDINIFLSILENDL